MGGGDQWIETARGADFADLFHGFEAYVAVGILKVLGQFGDGGWAGLGRITDILRADRLLRGRGKEQGAHNGGGKIAHSFYAISPPPGDAIGLLRFERCYFTGVGVAGLILPAESI